MAYDPRESLWNTPLEEFEEQKVLPAGHYYAVITRFEKPPANEKGTEAIDFFCSLKRPGEDVDETALNSALGDFSLTDYELRIRYFVTRRAMFRLRNLFTSLKQNIALGLDTMLPEAVGQEVLLTVTVGTYKRNNRQVIVNQVDECVGVASTETITDLSEERLSAE